jgi:hypothetical protein
MATTLEQDWERLEEWAQTLVKHIKSTKPAVDHVLQDDRPLPSGCPSKGALARMQFGDIPHDLRELDGAMKDIYEKLGQY